MTYYKKKRLPDPGDKMGISHTPVSNSALLNRNAPEEGLAKTFPRRAFNNEKQKPSALLLKKGRPTCELKKKKNQKEALREHMNKKRSCTPKNAFSVLSRLIEVLLIQLPELSS